jgi:hypothetical protein
MPKPALLPSSTLLYQVFFVVLPTVGLFAYTVYVTRFGLHQSAFRNGTTSLHNAPGLLVSVLGTAGWVGLLVFPTLWRYSTFWVLFAIWTVSFLVNCLTGFCMIPMLPNIDPSAKREFVPLFLVQISFLPFCLGLAGVGTASMTVASFVIGILGLISSVVNFILYLLDYADGKSSMVCSSKHLLDHIDQQKETRKRLYDEGYWAIAKMLFHDYIAILFQRGAEQTRMPANQTMVFIAATLIVPFPIFMSAAFRFREISTAYPPELLMSPNLVLLLLLSTVGNLQIFHGTLALRGKDTVTRSSLMVAVTVVLELLVGFANMYQALGAEHYIGYHKCRGLGLCSSSSVLVSSS